MNNKLGMFIHWGIYSIYGIHEQVLARYDLPKNEYEASVKEFNPTEFDAESIVLLAKNAGMKYICFTAKHHDGFCMWDTKYTDYNIMNTPYNRDILRMLADACDKHGIALSIYYSNPDWHHPSAYNHLSSHQWKSDPDTSNPAAYREFVKNQLRELCSNYGKLYTFFWDIPPRYEDRSFNELIRSLQPGILINNRGYDEGDFATPERTVPEGSRFKTLTEACQSVGSQSWGYRTNEDYYSARYLMSSIDKIMAMGGSYLLNIGPMPSGLVDSRSEGLIRRVGSWYNKVSHSLKDTEEDTFGYEIYGDDKFIAIKKGGKTYLHFYEGMKIAAISFTKWPGIPVKAVLLNSGEKLKVAYERLPELFWFRQEKSDDHVLRIRDIPVDDYPDEPIVIELTW
ncbi:MAG: alpha-L-fucosidase [Clostridiales bacterium]|nr:alpha-L-fucosidase [Clostridiales bacterium]